MEEKDQLFAMPGLNSEIIRFNKLLETFPDDHILIEGHRGTGKSYFLQMFEKHHKASKPILKINCATIPQELAASLLFGYVEGAFTGAKKTTTGLIDAVNEWGDKYNNGKGLLILEELNSLSRADQAKLLVFMETTEYYPVGSWQPKKAKVKFIATANFESEHKNRQDLIDRFGIFIQVPPLFARRDDIFYFIAKKYPELRMNTYGLMFLYNHNWPGNLRELERYLKEVEIHTRELAMWYESIDQKLSEATALLRAAGMSKTMFRNLEEECFDRVLPRQFGPFFRDYDEEEWDLNEFIKNTNPYEPLTAPLLRVQFRTNSIEPSLNEPLSVSLHENDFETPIIVLDEFMDKNYEPDGIKRGVNARMISKFLRMLFGNVHCPGPIFEQELFGGFPQDYMSNEIYIFPLPFKAELNNTKPESIHPEIKLETYFPSYVYSPAFSNFANYCNKVRELKIKGNASVVIEASHVAKFLLDGDEYVRFTEVVSAIKKNAGHGWQEKLANMLKVPKSTMSTWVNKTKKWETQ